jgi:hypothetical protein
LVDSDLSSCHLFTRPLHAILYQAEKAKPWSQRLAERFAEAFKKSAQKSAQKVVKSTVGNFLYFVPIAQANSAVEKFLVGLDASFADEEYLKHIAKTGSLLRPASHRMIATAISITMAVDDLSSELFADAEAPKDEDGNGSPDENDAGGYAESAAIENGTDPKDSVDKPCDEEAADEDNDEDEDNDSDDEIEREDADDNTVRAFDVTSDRFIEVLEEMDKKLKKKLISFVTGTDWSPSN